MMVDVEMEPTIQELVSSVSGKEAVVEDLIRVGEEALMESTQALILAPPFSASNLFINNILRSCGEKDLGTGRDDRDNKLLTPRDITSRTTTFCWLVIVFLSFFLLYLLPIFRETKIGKTFRLGYSQ